MGPRESRRGKRAPNIHVCRIPDNCMRFIQADHMVHDDSSAHRNPVAKFIQDPAEPSELEGPI